jgi:hypothetical protein
MRTNKNLHGLRLAGGILTHCLPSCQNGKE